MLHVLACTAIISYIKSLRSKRSYPIIESALQLTLLRVFCDLPYCTW